MSILMLCLGIFFAIVRFRSMCVTQQPDGPFFLMFRGERVGKVYQGRVEFFVLPSTGLGL